MSEKNCFHCGLPVDPDYDFPINYNGEEHSTCCPGCQAVAQSIIDSGLGQYYETRTNVAEKADLPPKEILDQIKLYDLEEVQEDFVNTMDGGTKEAVLMLDGITCSACVWLLEQRLQRVKGVKRADLNYTTHRARVEWDDSRVKLSDILLEVKKTGYGATPYDPQKYEMKQQRERRIAIFRLWVAGLSMMQVMMYAIPTYIYGMEIESQFLEVLHWASMALTLPVVLYSAVPFYKGFIRDIRNRRVGMDTPIALAVIIAFTGSLVALLTKHERGVFFDSISMFVFLLLAGRYLEQSARRKATDAAERLVKLVPSFCHKIPGWPTEGTPEEAVVAMLSEGDVVLVKPGETIPVDGSIVEGRSEVNEAMLTGESQPIGKREGSQVIAGSINLSEAILVKTENTGAKTRLGNIVRLLDKALNQKPKVALMADKYASLFISIVLAFALLVFIVWAVKTDIMTALMVGVSLLVITCPCALSLATPTALTAATGNLTDKGLLISNGQALETLNHITHIIFDKTGTLTEGELGIGGISTKAGHEKIETASHAKHSNKNEMEEYRHRAKSNLSKDERMANFGKLGDLDRSVAIATALEERSEHPIARAFYDFRSDLNDSIPMVEEHGNVIGQGVTGVVEGERYNLGRLSYAMELAGGEIPEWANEAQVKGGQNGSTLIALAKKGELLAIFHLDDTIKAEAKDTVAKLSKMGFKTSILSGDTEEAVKRVAKELGVDSSIWGATPESKLEYVQELQKKGEKVLMVGDGVNDAPVLALSDISIAMDTGADASQEGADMILISHELGLIVNAFKVARKTHSIIRENFMWAGLYNMVALPVAALGHATPALAALGMSTSSLLVVLNALRLLKVK